MRRTDLALRGLRVLAASGERLTAADLAEGLGSTPQFVPQVMTPLVRAGWVSSEPGPRGGYRLETDLETRTMLEFVELIEGKVDDGRCVLEGGPCGGTDECSLHVAWVAARTALIQRLGDLPVATT